MDIVAPPLVELAQSGCDNDGGSVAFRSTQSRAYDERDMRVLRLAPVVDYLFGPIGGYCNFRSFVVAVVYANSIDQTAGYNFCFWGQEKLLDRFDSLFVIQHDHLGSVAHKSPICSLKV